MEFAERFGMPMEWADPDLKWVEAAAWRKTKTGYVTCGWGGKKDACKEEEGGGFGALLRYPRGARGHPGAVER